MRTLRQESPEAIRNAPTRVRSALVFRPLAKVDDAMQLLGSAVRDVLTCCNVYFVIRQCRQSSRKLDKKVMKVPIARIESIFWFLRPQFRQNPLEMIRREI